jgi:hypothetical protein
MLVDRIVGAFSFRRQVYADVENDPSFTQTAWVLVAVVAFLNQLGTYAGGGIGRWLISSVVGAVFMVAGFAVAAFVVSWLGKALFQADVTFEETVRTLGLAYVWNIVGFIGVVAGLVPGLGCILTPLLCIAPILQLISWFIAAQEALDLDTGQTLITVILGVIVNWVIMTIAGVILGLMGLTAVGIGRLLGF